MKKTLTIKQVFIWLFCLTLNLTYSQNKLTSGIKISNNENLNKINQKDSLFLIIRKDKQDTNMAKAYHRLGAMLMDAGESDSAFFYLDKSLKLAEKIKFNKCIAYTNLVIGNLFLNQSKTQQALEKFNIVNKFGEENNFPDLVAKSLGGMGNVKFRMNELKEALNYFEAQKSIYQKTNNKLGLADTYREIAMISSSMGKNVEALNFTLKASEIYETLNYKLGIASCYENIGIAKGEQNKPDEAIKYFLKAKSVLEEIKYVPQLAKLNLNMAFYYYSIKKYDLAIECCNTCLNISKKRGYGDLIKNSENILSETYAAKGDLKSAFEHKRNYAIYTDSLMNDQITKRLIRSEMSLKFEKELLRQKSEQEKKDIITSEELKTQKIITVASALGFILVLILIFVLVRIYKRKIETNRIISQKNAEIMNQKANMQGQEEERKRIAKELHDGIGGTLAGIKLKLSDYNSATENKEMSGMIEKLAEVCKEVRSISHNLTPPSISNSSLTELLKGLVDQYNSLNKIEIHFDGFLPLDSKNITDDIKRDIYRVVQELFHNAFKYSGATKLTIDLFSENESLYLNVEDNGRGFNVSENSMGIGLKNIENRIKLLQGTVEIDSKPNRGTAVSIVVPLKAKE